MNDFDKIIKIVPFYFVIVTAKAQDKKKFTKFSLVSNRIMTPHAVRHSQLYRSSQCKNIKIQMLSKKKYNKKEKQESKVHVL